MIQLQVNKWYIADVHQLLVMRLIYELKDFKENASDFSFH